MPNYTANRAGIRQFVIDKPNSTVLEIANAIGMVYRSTDHAVRRMIKTGLLVSRFEKGCQTIMVGRDPLVFRYSTSEESKAATIQRQLERNQAAKQARAETAEQKRQNKAMKPIKFNKAQRVQETISTHDTQEFIDAGGHHDILPTQWQQPIRYPRISLSYAERSGRQGVSP